MTQKQAAWNAESYHQVSKPHSSWAERVLAKVPTSGISVTIDAGCGTGKITRELLNLLPDATVIAVDYSDAMLEVAKRELAPDFGNRVRYVQADLAQLTPALTGITADLIFSTATFHWLPDHDLLFRRLYDLLNPGGQLIAQCGGGANLARFRERVSALHCSPEFAPYFDGWREPWNFADDLSTASRLTRVGFTEVETDLEYHPAMMDGADAYAEFIRTVILREHLRPLPSEELKQRYVDYLTRSAGSDPTPYELDYWRLNLKGRRPAS